MNVNRTPPRLLMTVVVVLRWRECPRRAACSATGTDYIMTCHRIVIIIQYCHIIGKSRVHMKSPREPQKKRKDLEQFGEQFGTANTGCVDS